jgi:DMSO/TMAO reductase YedYZ heme-binding membrane subunit
VVVQLGGRLRHRLPPRWWHGLHRTAYAVALLVSVHAALVGTDAFRGGYWAASVLLAGVPLVAGALRLRDAARRRSSRPHGPSRTQPVPAAPAPAALP